VNAYNTIYQAVRQIPYGKVATYGQIAELANFYGKARLVGYALYKVDKSSDIPWHRVINAKGEISYSTLRYGGDDLQRSLLEKERILFSSEGKINLQKYLWKPNFRELN
jgi:methylated-DNA-protein-cysteine methyltransferase-like protein